MLNLVTYDPFRELRKIQKEMNRFFDAGNLRNTELSRGGWNPNVDIFETGDGLVIEAELAGLDPKDVEVSVENGVLTIHGERRFEKKDEGENFHRIERGYGTFTRSFTLPPTVSGDNVAAHFDNGVLRLELPKRTEAKPKKIEITTGEKKTDSVKTQGA